MWLGYVRVCCADVGASIRVHVCATHVATDAVAAAADWLVCMWLNEFKWFSRPHNLPARASATVDAVGLG